ncbi:MAG: toll/interleukin-1 receptor domain-containing protein [Bacteroidales bacterium]|nr:toll/interleukin-1 receptor domain-containing protein [Bacteroidales bacterium]
MTYDVFISYSRKDTAIADRICAAFDRAGISYFIDRQGIAGGMEFPKILAPAIKESEVFLLLASENAYQSPFTTREILYAFNKKRGEKMLPYIIDGSVLPDDVEFVFSSTNWRTMREHPIDPVLVDDVLRLLGRQRRTQATSSTSTKRYSQAELKEINRKGDEYYNANQYAKAVEWYRIAAEQGYADAQYSLGYMYQYGRGVPPDDAEAVRWYRKAAEQGHAVAQNEIGAMYYMGQGVTMDFAEAVRWYRKAADQGLARAQSNLGYMYQFGQGVTQDSAEAVRWYRKAAEQGYADAQYNLGIMYANGQGVTQDYAEAVRWYRKAAEQGLARAQCNLALRYKNGQGVPKDLSEARHWFQKAADQGDEFAKEQLRKL